MKLNRPTGRPKRSNRIRIAQLLTLTAGASVAMGSIGAGEISQTNASTLGPTGLAAGAVQNAAGFGLDNILLPIELVSGEIQVNPFIAGSRTQPAAGTVTDPEIAWRNGLGSGVVQASGQQLSVIRLKSINNAKTLVPLGDDVSANQPVVHNDLGRELSASEEASAAAIRVNPMALPDSVPMALPVRDDTAIPEFSNVPKVVSLKRVDLVVPEIVPEVIAGPIVSDAATSADIAPEVLSEPVVVPVIVSPVAVIEEVEAPVDVEEMPTELNEPVTFSLTDLSDDDISVEKHTKFEVPPPESGGEEKLSVATKRVNEDLPSLPQGVQNAKPIESIAERIRSNHFVEKNDVSNVKRYPQRRPPAVAVSAPPVASFSLGSDKGIVTAAPIIRATTASHRANELSPSEKMLDVDRHIDCEKGQILSLTLPADVQNVSVRNQDVCRVVGSVSRHLRIIGRVTGTTLIVIQYGDDPSDLRSMVCEIAVGDNVPTVNVDSTAKSATVSDAMMNSDDPLLASIAELFPNSRIRLVRSGNGLVVRGSSASRDEATEIVRMIRKVHLVPVDDQLVLR